MLNAAQSAVFTGLQGSQQYAAQNVKVYNDSAAVMKTTHNDPIAAGFQQEFADFYANIAPRMQAYLDEMTAIGNIT